MDSPPIGAWFLAGFLNVLFVVAPSWLALRRRPLVPKGFQLSGKLVLLFCGLPYLAVIAYFLGLAQDLRGEDRVFMVMVSWQAWFLAPAFVAILLADDAASPREWYRTAWYWTLDPLPVKVHHFFKWLKVDDLKRFESATMIVLQIATVLIFLGAVRLVWSL